MGTYLPASMELKTFFECSTEKCKDIIKNHPPGTTPFAIDLFFSPNFVSTIFMQMVFSVLLNDLFPKYKIAHVEIFTTNSEVLRTAILSSKKKYSITIFDVTGGYTLQPQKMIITNCMFLDAVNLLEIVRSVDKKCLFTLSMLKNLDGYIYST